MSERYPDDATLLALSEDDATGVEYIPTGRSPYYLEFRKMLHRLLRAAERANDLRVYADGDLSIGVRPGRALVVGNAIEFAGAQGIAVNADTATHVWLDAAGEVQSGTDGLPEDRFAFVPLAKIVAGPLAIESVIDLRGEAFLAIPSLTMLNIDATANEVNQALSGISPNVTGTALSTLTAGGSMNADAYHRHITVPQNEDAEVAFRIINHSSHTEANVAIQFMLPQIEPASSFLSINRANGFLQQRHDNVAYNLLGTVHSQYAHEGDLTTSVTDALIGVVPADGRVTDIILSIAANIESDDDDDGVIATVYANGNALAATDPSLVAADGAGFVSTAQSHGTPAAIVSNGDELVQRGDVLTVDLTRVVAGNVSSEARDIVVLIVIRADAPE